MKKISLCLMLLMCGAWPVVGAEYASLKYNKVNMRTGPSENYPIRWVYQEKTYPVEVLDSFELWRYVRDKDGEIGWIHQNQLNKSRYVLIEKEDFLLKKVGQPQVVATLQPGVIAKLDRCPEGNYCRLTVYSNDEKYTGWFLRSNLWGIDPNEIVE